MAQPLNRTTAASRQVPAVRVLQFGEGNFLRAFADWMIDLLNEKSGFAGAVKVVQPLSNGMGEQLNQQDGLYHVVLNGIQQGKAMREIRMISCLSGVINPYSQFDAFLREAENPELRFVISNTTESGIAFNPADTGYTITASGFPGKVTQLLYHRFMFYNGAPERGIVFLPCELIEENGNALKKCIIEYCNHWNLPEQFTRWVGMHNIFCNTLVDRIVPGFPAATINEIHEETGFTDKMVVMAEPFHLWVIEAPAEVQQQLPFDKAGLNVAFTDDLTPYRTRKVRILNGAHTCMVPVAYLQGLRTVKESIDDPLTGAFVKSVIYDEIIPTLDLPLSELEQFAGDVIERFQNPYIRHELESIALNSVSKFRVRVLPSLIEYTKRKGILPPLLVRSLAHLIVFYRGNYKSQVIPVKDSPEVVEAFNAAWQKPVEETVRIVLANESFWGLNLLSMEGLYEMVVGEVRKLGV